LPATAYAALLEIDLSYFDRGSPITELRWNRRLDRWTARLSATPTGPARRVPLRERTAPSGGSVPGGGSVPADGAGADDRYDGDGRVGDGCAGELWKLADGQATSVVTRQRAAVVLQSILGWNTASIARHTMMSARRVSAIIGDFGRDGRASLELSYGTGEPVVPTAAEQRDARFVAARGPREWGLSRDSWDLDSLAGYLVGEGLAEDVDPAWLDSLLPLAADGRPAEVTAKPR
jgi:hypothetical protein